MSSWYQSGSSPPSPVLLRPPMLFIAAAMVRCASELSAPTDIAEATKRARIASIDSTSSSEMGVVSVKVKRSRSAVGGRW